MPPPVAVSSFTIPSIHDDTPLECRIYHPAKFPANHGSGETVWRKKAAIIAHPYGPLGGSYDDPVVQSAVTEILKHGFVVGTFNFRYPRRPNSSRPVRLRLTGTYIEALAHPKEILAGLLSPSSPTTSHSLGFSCSISAVFDRRGSIMRSRSRSQPFSLPSRCRQSRRP